MDHLYALIRAAKKSGMRKIVIHAFLDGRDTPPQSGAGYLEQLELFLDKEGVGKIATVIGRYFAMDRDQNWDRIEKAESAIFRGEGRRFYDEKPSDIVRKLYAEGAQDEFMEPLVFVDDLGEPQTIRRNDGVFFFNFRADRARMLSKRIYERAGDMRLQFAAMTRYDKELPVPFLFGPENIATTLGEQIAKAGMTQVHIAETEKYAHATYFLNCGREQAYAGETDILVDSRKDVKTHDQAPEMRAKEITDKALESMEKGTDFIFINYANADMVGHTANKEAIICALETLDRELKRLLEGIFAKEGVAFITADHGNAEMNVDPETGQKHTAHTLDPVPAIVTSKRYSLDSGGLADIAPTILELLNLPKGEGMGRSLLAARNS
jgi:2,3-bisphosphoglycerate-independent phosphoglycerate mutase